MMMMMMMKTTTMRTTMMTKVVLMKPVRPAAWPSEVVLVQLGQVAGATGKGWARGLNSISHHAPVVALPSPLLGERQKTEEKRH